jgi:hypothetical protein
VSYETIAVERTKEGVGGVLSMYACYSREVGKRSNNKMHAQFPVPRVCLLRTNDKETPLGDSEQFEGVDLCKFLLWEGGAWMKVRQRGIRLDA